jgi:dihydropyrimidine dehydrogenase (NADP+)
MLAELKRLKQEYPDRVLIASIMVECRRDAWAEIIGRCQEAGVDGFEINFSCPHGMPERRMGMAMGQDPELLSEVCGWINAEATVPVWAKMTPNVTDITAPARAALRAGCEGVAAINTVASVMGVSMATLRPEPCVEGYSTQGGYSSRAVKPIALAKVQSIASMIASEFPASGGSSISGIGGVESGRDAAEFLLLGASTVQVCTGVMVHGYGLVGKLAGELQDVMVHHRLDSVSALVGRSLPYFTTHSDLVRRQRTALDERRAARTGLASDAAWTGDGFVAESEGMVSNK